MVDACVIVRPGGRGAYNTGTLTYAADLTPTAIYTGKCRLRRNALTDEHPEGGDRPAGTGQHLVTVPMSVTTVRLDDSLTVTASSLDAALVGLRLRVTAITKGSHVTARRLICEELTP